MIVANTLAYYNTTTIMAIKCVDELIAIEQELWP
jgi:hypothetical protein